MNQQVQIGSKTYQVRKQERPRLNGANYKDFAVKQVSDVDVTDIELSEEEEGRLLYEALEKKRYSVGTARYLKRCAEQEASFKKITPGQMLNFGLRKMQEILQKRHGEDAEVVVDKWNQDQLRALSLYFAGSHQFEDLNPKFSLSKGLLIQGTPGCGKTLMMRVFQQNAWQSFRLVDIAEKADEITDEQSRNEITSQLSSIFQGSKNAFGHNRLGICIDDAGFEIDRKLYGNPVDLLLAVIRKRYSKDISGRFTHMITNLTVSELTDRYGDRFASRISEMFNQITFSPQAPDRRKLFNNQKS